MIRFLLALLFVVTSTRIQSAISFSSLSVTQLTGACPASSSQPLLLLTYATGGGGGGTCSVNSLVFTITGMSEISGYKLYFNTTNSLATATLQTATTTLNSPLAGDVTLSAISGVSVTSATTFYVWLVVDMNASIITPGATIDASYKSGTYSPAFAPATSSPAGNRIAGDTYTIKSAGGHYTTVGAAVTALNSSTYSPGYNGNVYYEVYNSTTEAASQISINYGTPNYQVANIFFRPASGVSGITSSANPGSATALIRFNGADNVTFDGRPAGVGTLISNGEWTIRNTRTAATIGSVFDFIDDATSNTLKFLKIEGESSANGLVHFQTTSLTTGNDNNTISYCYIQDRTDGSGTAAFPINGISSSGTANKANSGNVIDNNYFIDIYGSTIGSTWNISLANNGGLSNDAWTISNNHFYHKSTTSIPTATNYHGFIYVAAGSSYNITGNYLGGQSSSCGGAAYTFSSTSGFIPIYLPSTVSGASTTITVNSNTISNMSYSSSINGACFTGISFNGPVTYSIGANGAGNLIGSTTTTASIQITHNNVGATNSFYGIRCLATGTNIIAYNAIGGITLNAGTATSGVDEIMIYNNAANTTTIDNNLIGSTTTANSIDIKEDAQFTGIFNDGSSGVTITNNTLQNIKMGANGYEFFAIQNAAGKLTCTGNTISDITHLVNSDRQFYMISHGGGSDPIATVNTSTATISTNAISNISSSGASTVQFLGIILNSSASGNVINSNTIGNTSSNNININQDDNHFPIYAAGVGTYSINNNILQQIYFSNAGSNTLFYGIYAKNGELKSCTNNTLTNITSDGTSASASAGIGLGSASTGVNLISGNSISNFNAAAGLRGIFTNTDYTVTISNNTIGSLSNNNILISGNSACSGIYCDASSTVAPLPATYISGNTIQEWYISNSGTTASLNGIYLPGTSVYSVSTNVIKNMDNNGTNAGTIMRGIYVSNGATAGSAITQNTITSLNAINTGTNASITYGIYTTSCPGLNLKKNFINELNHSAVTGIVRGIYVGSGINAHNNVVLLSNSENASVTGIHDITAATSPFIYHNTILVVGTYTGSANSYAYNKTGTGAGSSTLKLNLFLNQRSGGTGKHFSVGIANSTTPSATLDYNYLESLDATNGYIGEWAGAAQQTLANWQTASSRDASSVTNTITLDVYGKVVTSPFVGAGMGLNLSATVADDFEAVVRPIAPTTGAYETLSTLPIELLSFTGTRENDENVLTWITATEINNKEFIVERSTDGLNFSEMVNVIPGAGNSNNSHYYSTIDDNLTHPIYYYRLKQIDFDNSYSYSNIISIDTENDLYMNALVFPNPIANDDILNFNIKNTSNLTNSLNIKIFNALGMLCFETSQNKSIKTINLKGLNLSSGIYTIQFYTGNSILNSPLIIK